MAPLLNSCVIFGVYRGGINFLFKTQFPHLQNGDDIGNIYCGRWYFLKMFKPVSLIPHVLFTISLTVLASSDRVYVPSLWSWMECCDHLDQRSVAKVLLYDLQGWMIKVLCISILLCGVHYWKPATMLWGSPGCPWRGPSRRNWGPWPTGLAELQADCQLNSPAYEWALMKVDPAACCMWVALAASTWSLDQPCLPSPAKL